MPESKPSVSLMRVDRDKWQVRVLVGSIFLSPENHPQGSRDEMSEIAEEIASELGVKVVYGN